MPRKCSYCAHEHCEEINMLLMQNVPYAKIVEQYGGSITALYRHKQHLTISRPTTEEVAEVSEPGVVMSRIAELNAKAEYIYREAVKTKDLLNAGRALKELREIVALYAKITGELNTQAQVVHQHVHINPEWVALRQTMLNALAPYPEARAALVAALEGAQDLTGGEADV